MIIFENNSRKMFFITLAVFLSAGFIVYQYFKINPFGRIDPSPITLLPQINQIVSQESTTSQELLPIGTLDFSLLEEEFKKEQDKQELLEQAREYLKEKTDQLSPTSTDPQNIE